MKLQERLKEWLGEEGVTFFTDLKKEHGTINVVLSIKFKDSDSTGPAMYFPHPVHYREGMSVRNWLRAQPECANWDSAKLEADWDKLVEQALDL